MTFYEYTDLVVEKHSGDSLLNSKLALLYSTGRVLGILRNINKRGNTLQNVKNLKKRIGHVCRGVALVTEAQGIDIIGSTNQTHSKNPVSLMSLVTRFCSRGRGTGEDAGEILDTLNDFIDYYSSGEYDIQSCWEGDTK